MVVGAIGGTFAMACGLMIAVRKHRAQNGNGRPERSTAFATFGDATEDPTVTALLDPVTDECASEISTTLPGGLESDVSTSLFV
jgi:hypothetical protein